MLIRKSATCAEQAMKVIYTKKEDFIEVKIEMKKERLNAEERS
jgi:hypothetical protein